MKRKSKFLTFILSIIPGIGHFYLGLFERGFIYLFLFGGVSLGSIFMWTLTNWNGFVVVGLGGGAVIWLIALLDAFASINSMRYRVDMTDDEKEAYAEKAKKDNKRITTLALSIIPGAGHMYLGYQKKGLLFMAGFFFTMFFMGWLNLSLLVFILPLIWFYSFFDTYHTLNGKEVEDLDFQGILPKIKDKYIGIGLITIGIIAIFQNMIFPIVQKYFIYEVGTYLQTTIVSLIFIIGGIKMLQKKNKENEAIEILEEEIEDEE